MKWKGRNKSTNVEDRRGSGLGMGGKSIIGGGFGIVALIIYMLFGGNPGDILNQTAVINPSAGPAYTQTAEEQALAEFVSVVLADTEYVWEDIFAGENRQYQKPTLVLYSDYVQSACGTAGSSTGPFYCPGDSKVYVDLSFYKQLQTTFNAPGDFAMAYVIAHEVGHHVQNQLGVMAEVQQVQARVNKADANELSVRLELQADYLAGVWAHYAENMNILEPGDIEEAMNAASAVGDDRIQKQSQGYVVPDSFTHGTSEQRMRWFMKGFETGDLSQWDTFSPSEGNL